MKKIIFLFSVLFCSLVFSQKDYNFDYFSQYQTGEISDGKPLENTFIYDNSKDTSYQFFVYPEEAKLVDETYNEVHYFKKEVVNDSIKYHYDYSLKVFFQPDIKISGVSIKKNNDIDYEITYTKVVDDKRSKHIMEVCLQESEDELLNTAYLELGKKETATLFNQLKKVLNPDKNYFAQTIFVNSGRYKFIFDRVALKKESLTVTIPIEKHYKNSFLKK